MLRATRKAELKDEAEPESGRGTRALTAALPARCDPDVRAALRGLSAEPATWRK